MIISSSYSVPFMTIPIHGKTFRFGGRTENNTFYSVYYLFVYSFFQFIKRYQHAVLVLSGRKKLLEAK